MRLCSLRTCANTLGCWLSGEVPEPGQGLDAVAQQFGTGALVDLSKPGDEVAVAVGPDAAADPFDGLQLGVAELVLVAGQADRQPDPAGSARGKVVVGVGDEMVHPGLAEAGVVVIVGDQVADYVVQQVVQGGAGRMALLEVVEGHLLHTGHRRVQCLLVAGAGGLGGPFDQPDRVVEAGLAGLLAAALGWGSGRAEQRAEVVIAGAGHGRSMPPPPSPRPATTRQGPLCPPPAPWRPPPRSSTPSRSAPATGSRGRPRATTPPRRSTAANGTWRWTPAGCCWTSWSPPPACKTATAAGGCCGASAATCRPSGWSGPMPATPASWSPGRNRSSPWPCGSSASARASTTSRSCRAAGSWSGPSPGLASAAGWPSTTSASPSTTRPGCSGPWCA